MEALIIILLYIGYIYTKSKGINVSLKDKLDVNENELSEKAKKSIESAEQLLKELKTNTLGSTTSVETFDTDEVLINLSDTKTEGSPHFFGANEKEYSAIIQNEAENLTEALVDQNEKNEQIEESKLEETQVDFKEKKETVDEDSHGQYDSIEEYLAKDLTYFESLEEHLIQTEEEKSEIKVQRKTTYRINNPYRKLFDSQSIKKAVIISEVLKRPVYRK